MAITDSKTMFEPKDPPAPEIPKEEESEYVTIIVSSTDNYAITSHICGDVEMKDPNGKVLKDKNGYVRREIKNYEASFKPNKPAKVHKVIYEALKTQLKERVNRA